jgi:7-cyano-7-deazaguanine synthase
MSDSVVIVSGGMDSVTLLHYLINKLQKQPAVITFLYGQKHAKEVEFAQKNAELLACRDHTIVDLAALQQVFSGSALTSAAVAIPPILEVMGDPQPPTYVPNRNMIFLALAVAYAETLAVDTVYYGAQRHDVYGYWDTTPQFLQQLNQVYALNRKTPVHIAAPFVDFSKAAILRVGLEMGVDYALTWSCYAGGAAACGICPTCAERLKAFEEVGSADPLPYVQR